ncbi:MAG: hypothetical protein AVDCRST_MAG52-2460, partial [uncultured Blastococcus sp.]
GADDDPAGRRPDRGLPPARATAGRRRRPRGHRPRSDRRRVRRPVDGPARGAPPARLGGADSLGRRRTPGGGTGPVAGAGSTLPSAVCPRRDRRRRTRLPLPQPSGDPPLPRPSPGPRSPGPGRRRVRRHARRRRAHRGHGSTRRIRRPLRAASAGAALPPRFRPGRQRHAPGDGHGAGRDRRARGGTSPRARRTRPGRFDRRPGTRGRPAHRRPRARSAAWL